VHAVHKPSAPYEQAPFFSSWKGGGDKIRHLFSACGGEQAG